VFLLGAGASWHYGYPTGDDLVKKVVTRATSLGNLFRDTGRQEAPNLFRSPPTYFERFGPASELGAVRMQWRTAASELLRLAERLTHVRPLLIDYFLAQNDDLQEVGELWV
jgi:hypothetical protein